jgi:copper homeostasis protein
VARVTVEVCLDDLAGVRVAEAAGADRIELCAALADGGITPSIGTVAAALRLAHRMGIAVLIRQRPGDFVFSDDEVSAMVDDILAIRALPNPAGVPLSFVIGALAADGTVDVAATKRMHDACGEAQVTFHKAFDQVPDRAAALEQLIGLGIARVLTSGGRDTAAEGAHELAALVEQARGRVGILAGGGVRPSNVSEIVRASAVAEVHLTATELVPSAAAGGAPTAYDSGYRAVTSSRVVGELLAALGRSAA